MEHISDDIWISMVATLCLATALTIGAYVLFRMLRRKSDRKYLERHSEWAKEDIKVKQRNLDLELARSVLCVDVAKVKSSLKLGARQNAYRFDNKDTLLHTAKRIGDENLVDALLKRMSAVEIAEKNANGETANQITKENEFAQRFLAKNVNHKVLDKKTTQYLCKDVNVLKVADEKTGDTILHIAAERGSVECVFALVNRAQTLTSLDKDFKLSSILNRKKETVLHCAVKNKDPDTVRHILTLCEKDKYITAVQDADGNTVLHAAATRPEIFDIIITRVPPGAMNVRNNKNITAKELNISLDPTMDVDTFE